jgi:hypothetical protein
MIGEALKFVKGAVSTKNFVPAMQHFAIKDGKVSAFNGVVALSSPVDVDLSCAPKAAPLVAALDRCSDVVSLDLMHNDRLHVKSSGFGVFIECMPLVELPQATPTGDVVELNGELFIEALQAVRPFIGDDASRPWSNGVLLSSSSAYATNNVTLVQYWIGSDFATPVVIPLAAVKELLRIKQTPTHVQLSNNSATFHFPGDRWLHTLLLDAGSWPNLAGILEQPSNPEPVPEGLFEGLANLKPFVESTGRVYLHPGYISTSAEVSLGAYQRVDELQHSVVYNYSMLCLLDGVAERIDFSTYPAPNIFFGGRIRGAIIGTRL